MIVLITNILWILYSMLEGFREGFYWYFKGISKSKNDFEIHPVFASQRGIILILIGVMLSFTIGWFSILNTVGMALVFSFFHNGSYYVTRNRIDSKVYPLKWMVDEGNDFDNTLNNLYKAKVIKYERNIRKTGARSGKSSCTYSIY